MLQLIRHRGPDDEGWVAVGESGMAVGGGRDTPLECFASALPYAPCQGAVVPADAWLAIGHRRLSILDVSPGGHQPMSYRNGRYWVAFNGEIYNHDELRRTLEALGHRFISHSDTEVLLASYAEWGQDCLPRFQGMFSFVLVDRVAKTFFAARDRFGIKPLYYWVSPFGTLAFASEIKQFTALPGWSPVINGQRAYDFLAWSILDHTDETLFQGVYQLLPGTSIHLDLSRPLAVSPGTRLASDQWYRLAGADFDGSFDTAATLFRDHFEDAVRAHLHADVPVGSCLSGGLDSSSIVCMANRILVRDTGSADQHVFSSCAKVKRFDEREYIEEVVRSTSVAPHYLYPDLDDLFGQLDELTWHQDEPFGSTSIYAQWSVFAAARSSGVKVMLDGQGADELLAGYPIFFGANYARLLRQGRWLALAHEIRETTRLHGYGAVWAARYLANTCLPQGLRDALRALSGKATATPAWLDVGRLGATPRDPFRAAASGPMSVRSLSLQQLQGSNLQMLLHWEDRDSMAHSIEARVPFLDHRLVEFVVGLPDGHKIADGVTKRVLREGLRGVLPERIRTRMSKLGFATPEEHWVCRDQPDRFRRAVADAVSVCGGLLTPAARDFAEEVIASRRPFDFSIWRMISFARWVDVFSVRLP